MRSTGNTLSNQKYNPNNKSPPTTSFSGGDASEDIELERYIRDKYERKSFMSKVRKSPPFQGVPERINTTLGPFATAQRSPSLGSNSSTNLKPGQQRVSGESFERARSPASTNSSVELAPPPPPPPKLSRSSDPLAWTGLDSKGLSNPSPSSVVPTTTEVLFSQPTQGVENDIVLAMASMNPFQNSSNFAPLPPPQPLPEVPQFASQIRMNPFDDDSQHTNEQTTFNLQQTQSMPTQQASAPMWNPAMSYHSTASQGQQTAVQSTVSVQRAPTSSQPPGLPQQNPFIPQQTMSSPHSPSSTNPFFPSQPAQSPVYQPQTQPLYRSQNQSLPQPLYQPQYQPRQYQSSQTQPTQYVQTPLQTYTSSTQINVNPAYTRQRMDKQSILNLYNSSPPPTPSSNPQFIQNQNGVPAWSQQGI